MRCVRRDSLLISRLLVHFKKRPPGLDNDTSIFFSFFWCWGVGGWGAFCILAFCQDSQRGTKLLLGTATGLEQRSQCAQGALRRSVKFVTEAGRHQGEAASRPMKYVEYKDANVWIGHISLFKVSLKKKKRGGAWCTC